MRKIASIWLTVLVVLAGCDGETIYRYYDTDGGGGRPDAVVGDGGVDAERPTETIADIVAADARFGTLASALTNAGLADTFADEEQSFTVFAPTDDAFALLPEGLVENAEAATIETVLKYHVVSGEVPAATATTLDEAETLAGLTLKLTVDGETLYLDGLTAVVQTDIRASNGIIHVIDSVLIPGEFPGTLAQLMNAYPRVRGVASAAGPDVVAALGGEDDLTVFAPQTSALEGIELPEQSELDSIILYHAVPGSHDATEVSSERAYKTANGAYVAVQVSDQGVALFDSVRTANVLYTDRTASNGVLHVIDSLITPPGNIVEVAVANGNFSILAQILAIPQLSEIVATLTGEDPLTVFAPADSAWERYPQNANFAENTPAVLLHHVLEGIVDSADVSGAIGASAAVTTATTADDNELMPMLVGDAVVLDALTTVTMVDIPASNGLIHVVDSVLLPADIAFPGNLVEAAQAHPMLDKLVEAVTNADASVATALTGEDPLTVFAPINPAFNGVDTTSDLTPVLTYHVVPGSNSSADVGGLIGQDVATVNGATIGIEAGGLRDGMNNLRTPLRFDLQASNGIIHVIDGVLMPPAN